MSLETSFTQIQRRTCSVYTSNLSRVKISQNLTETQTGTLLLHDQRLTVNDNRSIASQPPIGCICQLGQVRMLCYSQMRSTGEQSISLRSLGLVSIKRAQECSRTVLGLLRGMSTWMVARDEWFDRVFLHEFFFPLL